jgi:hypothetical protein
MAEQENEQQGEQTPEEGDETMKDLDVPEGDAEDVKGGRKAGGDDEIIAI